MKRKTKKTIQRIATRQTLARGAAAMAAATMLVLIRRKLWYRHNAQPALHELDNALLPQSQPAEPAPPPLSSTGGPEAQPRHTVPGILHGAGYGEVPGI